MTASPRSPSPSQAPSGTVRASSASGIEKIDRRWRLGHEGSVRQTGPLRDLSCSAGPRSRTTVAQKSIPAAERSNLALNHGRRERNFWMQRRSAKNRHSNGRTPAETKIRESSGRKSAQKGPIHRRDGNARFAETG